MIYISKYRKLSKYTLTWSYCNVFHIEFNLEIVEKNKNYLIKIILIAILNCQNYMWCFIASLGIWNLLGIVISIHYFHRLTGDNLYMHVAHFDPVLLWHASPCLGSHHWSLLPLPKWLLYFSALKSLDLIYEKHAMSVLQTLLLMLSIMISKSTQRYILNVNFNIF